MSYCEPDNAEAHFDAIGDTGEGYAKMGRLYVVRCIWCDRQFTGSSKKFAIARYREHEDELRRKLRDELAPPVADPPGPPGKSVTDLLNDFPD